MILIPKGRDDFIFYRCIAMFTSRREKFMEVQVTIDFSLVLVECNVFLQSDQPQEKDSKTRLQNQSEVSV